MSTFADLVALIKRLRGPQGCPWDREQTPASLRPYILEEAYEVLDAIDGLDPQALRDELGDLLLQVVLQAELAAETGSFTIDDVVAAIVAKMIRRHPHVFGGAQVADSAEVLHRWSRIKAEERAGKEPTADRSALSGLPPDLPALHAAYRMGEKATRVGFDWISARDALDKVREEIDELDRALAEGDANRVEQEVGDALFALASVARLADCNPEMALRAALARFARRFRRIEAWLAADRRDIHLLSAEELDALWVRAKAADSDDG